MISKHTDGDREQDTDLMHCDYTALSVDLSADASSSLDNYNNKRQLNT